MRYGLRGPGRLLRGLILAAILSWQAGAATPREITVTAYCKCEKCCGKWAAQGYVQRTASGSIPQAGKTVAGSRDFKFGQRLELFGRVYIVEDRVSEKYRRNRIDIFMDSHDAARKFGVKKTKI